MAKALGTPLTDLSFDDREIILSQGPLPIFNSSSLLQFNQLLCRLGLRSGMRDKQLEEHVKKARSLEGTRLGLEELAQFLTLPVSDTLTQVYNLFEQSEDGQMDIRHYIVALSTVLRPPKSFETLKLAFEMYENERGEILEEDLAVVMEIMLGVKDVDLSGLFLAQGKLDERKITYDELHHLLENTSHLSLDGFDFKDHPGKGCISRPKSCNGQSHDKDK
uniref:Lysophosphatidylcholine acyltransferase 1 n=1 Tax=Nothobranchius kuhntae TaxID=321403 RepID=A0A1A8JJG3_NOTKU